MTCITRRYFRPSSPFFQAVSPGWWYRCRIWHSIILEVTYHEYKRPRPSQKYFLLDWLVYMHPLLRGTWVRVDWEMATCTVNPPIFKVSLEIPSTMKQSELTCRALFIHSYEYHIKHLLKHWKSYVENKHVRYFARVACSKTSRFKTTSARSGVYYRLAGAGSGYYRVNLCTNRICAGNKQLVAWDLSTFWNSPISTLHHHVKTVSLQQGRS